MSARRPARSSTPWPRRASRSPRIGVDAERAAPLLVALGEALDGSLPPCADDPDVWTSTDPTDVAVAVAGCTPCPARTECRAYATALRPGIGTWAGRAVYVRRSTDIDTEGWTA